jgi:hypothetical protein
MINSQNNLAKCGYIPDMKVLIKKNRILLYSWLPTGTYHKNLVILKNNSSFFQKPGLGFGFSSFEEWFLF